MHLIKDQVHFFCDCFKSKIRKTIPKFVYKLVLITKLTENIAISTFICG